jgi:hypothetical protein
MKLPRRAIALGMFLTVSATGFVHSAEYLPLIQGMRWRYESAEGLRETQTVDGTATIWGTQTAIIRYTESSSNEGLENYWTNTPDGDVFIWGFSLGPDFGAVYDPPILFVDAPLFVGKTWAVTADVYSLPDTSYRFTYVLTFSVDEAEPISVPAGEFFSFGISYTQNPPGSIDGRAVVPSRGGGPRDWFGEGVGRVQYYSDGLYQLVDFGEPTSAQSTSWGAIKGLYR